MNRLKLDWALETMEARTAFTENYLKTLKNPTAEELETISNYILWGKDSEGFNLEQRGEIELPRKNQNWAKQNDKVKSLDELLETPGWNENEIITEGRAAKKIKREVFSRLEARQKANPTVLKALEQLWDEIDRTELTLNFYDLSHGKRKTPPRETLLNKFSQTEVMRLRNSGENLSQFTYLKMRHLLVDLRSQQYAFKDTYTQTISMDPTNVVYNEPIAAPTFEVEIPVFPFGTVNKKSKIFKSFADLVPQSFSEEDLKEISSLIWEREKKFNSLSKNERFFDFENPEHVYNLFNQYIELKESIDETEEEETSNLFKTLEFYISMAELNEVQSIILQLKIRKKKNQEIAAQINSRFHKSYTANYISTIFHQKIIPQINESASFHKKILQNIFFEEEFKKCTTCGRTMLRDSKNFVRKQRSKDGYSNRCKCCDKKDRELKKILVETKNNEGDT